MLRALEVISYLCSTIISTDRYCYCYSHLQMRKLRLREVKVNGLKIISGKVNSITGTYFCNVLSSNKLNSMKIYYLNTAFPLNDKYTQYCAMQIWTFIIKQATYGNIVPHG